MSDSLWIEKGATLSHKNACKEFGFTEEEVIKAIKLGKLQYRQGNAHGNPYFKLLRVEVEKLAKDLYGDKGMEEQEIKYKLKNINREINSLKRKLSSLEKQKIELIEMQNQIKTQ